MKKTIYLILLLVSSHTLKSQTTAIDFNLKDCNGIQHSLFSLVDSGNVVILIYEHECPSCFAGVTNLKNVLAANFSDKINIKILYLDNGANACSTTKKWVQKNNFPEGLYFRFSNDFTSPYGEGMPVIVIVSGKSHKVFLKAASPEEANTDALKTAIENALLEVD
jgi:hypothetical protein